MFLLCCQLMQTIRHPSAVICMDQFRTKMGIQFTTHYNKGAVNSYRTWLLKDHDKSAISGGVA